MENLVLIIIVVFGILQLILFFKIWAMTNDVKKIKESIYTDPLNLVRKHLLKGDREKAKEALIDGFIFDVQSFEDNNKYDSVSAIVKLYKPIFEKLGFEFPEELEKIERFTDYKSIL